MYLVPVLFTFYIQGVLKLKKIIPAPKKLPVTIPVAPIITGTIVHFRFHIRCISIHKLLYFIFFSASFCTTFLSAGIVTSISADVISFLFLIVMCGLFAVTSLSVCVM